MKKRNFSTKVVSFVSALSLAVSPLAINLMQAQNVYAASLSDITVNLESEAVNTAGDVTITFTTPTALTAPSIEISYDGGSGAGDWFEGGSAIVTADVTVTSTDTNLDGTCSVPTSLNGYLRLDCTGDAALGDTITIVIGDANQLTTPDAAGNYNFSVTVDTNNAGNYDYGAGLAYVANANDVTVTAIVPPVLDLAIYEQNNNTLTNSCDLGVLSISTVKSCSYDLAGSTNAPTGLTVQTQGVLTSDWTTGSAVLTHSNGTDDINAVAASGSVDAGSEEYGFAITDDGSSNQYNGGIYEKAGATNTSAPTEPIPTSETVLASTASTIDGINNQADRLEVTHYASMGLDTLVGSYDQGVVYTAYTN
jgi:hypothetical protein